MAEEQRGRTHRLSGRAAAPALAIMAAFGLALFAHGCATPLEPLTDVKPEKEYRTGSNIPVRDRAGPSDAKSYDADSIRDALQRTMPATPAGLKGG